MEEVLEAGWSTETGVLYWSPLTLPPFSPACRSCVTKLDWIEKIHSDRVGPKIMEWMDLGESGEFGE